MSRPPSRTWYILACVVTIAAGLGSRHFPQLLPEFLGKYPGDALWTLMVFFGLGAIFRPASRVRLALLALGFAYGIEILKLYRAPWLVNARQTTLGHLIFGSVFSWQNLVAYTIGVIVGVLLVQLFANDFRSAVGSRST